MVNGNGLKQRLRRAVELQSGLEERHYLGMSAIGQCPRRLYLELMNGRTFPEILHWYTWTGYMHEAAVVGLLAAAGGAEVQERQVELVAEWDERFRGHIDGTWDGDLIEIKSVNWEKYQRLIEAGKPDSNHVAQVQMYMRHGGWNRAFIIYVARDIEPRAWQDYPLWVYEVGWDDALIQKLEDKARMILAAVDGGGPIPTCECGRCG